MSANGRKQTFWVSLLFIGIDGPGLEAGLGDTDKPNYMWFDSTLTAADGNCHHFEFETENDFC